MVVALGIVGLIYLAAEAIMLALTVGAAAERNVLGVLGGLMFAGAIVGGLLAQIRKPERLILRTVRAKPLEASEHL